MTTRKTKEQFIIDAVNIHGDKYSYDNVIYKNDTEKVNITCNFHKKDFPQSPNSHLRGSGCMDCHLELQSIQQTKSLPQFIADAKGIHGEKYNYDKSIYKGTYDKLTITCSKHGDFEQMPNTHLLGAGCNQCGVEIKTKTLEQFLEEANQKHNFKYSYSETKYKNSYTKIIIICPIHGDFSQQPYLHLLGIGCKECAKISMRLTQNEFVERSNKIHNNKYDYSETIYNFATEKVEINCPINNHGSFFQRPHSHMAGSGCPKCSSANSISKGETEWLNHLNIPDDRFHRQVRITTPPKNLCVDGFDPLTNTAYQYHGDLWHGNPKFHPPDGICPKTHRVFGDIYKDTLEKEQRIRAAGYNLVVIWEHEWISIKKQLNTKKEE